MASNADLAVIGASGVAYDAAVGSTGPTGFGALDAAFVGLGYISDDGLLQAIAQESKEFTPWGSYSPIRRIITKRTTTFKITCWETNERVLALYYSKDPAVMVPSGGVISFNENVQPVANRRAFVFDVNDGSNLIRHYAASAEVTEVGNLVYKADSLIGYELTITAYPAADGNSVHHFYQIAGA